MNRLLQGMFRELVETAKAGKRCPTRAEIGMRTKHITALARQGHVRVEIFGRNWRVVTILKGEHAGLATAPPPAGGLPHLVIERAGAERRTYGVGGLSVAQVVDLTEGPRMRVAPGPTSRDRLLDALRAAKRVV